MFKDEVTAVGNAAKGKINLLEHNFTGYIMMSLLAGLYIALGSILMGIVGGVFTGGGSYATKLACGQLDSLVVVPFVAIPLFVVLLVWWFVDSKRKKISHDELVAMLDKPESDDNVENLPDKESSKDET